MAELKEAWAADADLGNRKPITLPIWPDLARFSPVLNERGTLVIMMKGGGICDNCDNSCDTTKVAI